jgi:multidrug efflux pump subunit AcrA (membrane-fusion protein)
MEKSKWAKRSVLAIITMLAMGGLVFGPAILATGDENEETPVKTEIPVFSVKTANAEKRTLHAVLDVNGDFVSGQQVEVLPDVSGKLVRLYVALGTQVHHGDIIAEVDPSRPGVDYMTSPVYAPISGTVDRIPLSVGMMVSPATSITAVSTINNLEIIARIPEREIAGLKTGLGAQVTLQAYPGEIFSAVITHVSPILDSASRTKLITLKLNRNDSRVNAGMFAHVRITTNTYQNVLTVPSEAIVNKHGVTTVYVLDGTAASWYTVQRNVETGITLNSLTEIKSGLSEGEAVVIQGQQLLNGGEAVRVINAAASAGSFAGSSGSGF